MISEDRGPEFWTAIASHPEVRKTLFGQPPEKVGEHSTDPRVRHFASEHGGWLFVQTDALGLIFDLHAMFTPEGWGREAHGTLKHGLRAIFERAHIVFNYETQCPRSRPPLSFGFRSTGGVTDTHLGPLRSWVLTRAAWAASPAHRRA